MKKSIIYGALTTATAIGIAACSSGGSDVAGIGGSGVTPTGGVVSAGTITGFGSIFVNGVEFETSSSTISVDDSPGSESDLAIGMRVTVNGEINDDGVTGTATNVNFDDDLQGPVNNLSDPDPDGVSRTFTVFGITARINSTSTNFDVSDDVTAPVTFDFDNIAENDHVELSGYYDSTGALVATRIELESQTFSPGNDTVELKGTITGLSNNTFNLANISGVTIDASAAAIEDLPDSQLADGAFVEVKGMCSDTSCTTINATVVEGESDDFNEDDKVEVEGLITDYIDNSNFKVNGHPVDASSATKEPASLVLTNDVLVEVEGTVSDGVLIASKVEQEGGEIKVAALVAGFDASAGSFDLEPVSGSGQTIKVMIDTSTEIEDDISEINSAALLDDLSIGDFIVVEGYDDGTGTVIASEVKRESEDDDIIVQGIMQSFNQDQDVTVLGVTFTIQDPETKFEQDNDETDDLITQSEFIAGTTDNQSVIKIVDKNDPPDDQANGVADEIEIED